MCLHVCVHVYMSLCVCVRPCVDGMLVLLSHRSWYAQSVCVQVCAHHQTGAGVLRMSVCVCLCVCVCERMCGCVCVIVCVCVRVCGCGCVR